MATDRLSELQARLKELKAEGHSTVDLQSLETFLTAEAGSEVQVSPELQAAHDHAWSLSLMESTFGTGDATLKAATLINGGAAVALLAFMGNLANMGPLVHVAVPSLGRAMLCFTAGVFLSGLGYLARFLTAFFGKLQHGSCAGVSVLAMIALSLGSLGAFAMGGYRAFTAIWQ